MWKLETLWNDTLAQKQKPLVVRDHIWAGEIGKNYYERYQKMMGIEAEKGFEDRVLRKFSAGIWFEEQIGYILKTIGILESAQESIEIPETDINLKVTGRMDYVAGGNPDWNIARERVKSYGFPTFIEAISLKIIDSFEEKYPEGLEKAVIEVKSVNSQVFWAKKDYLQEAYPHHVMQLYTYLKATGNKLGKVIYISKDDLTIKEMEIELDNPALENKWKKDVETMTEYYRKKEEPPKPDEIIFDPRKKLNFQINKQKHTIVGCYTSNWEVAWSNYFSLITGCKDEDEWLSKINPLIAEKNLILKDDYKKQYVL